VLAFAAAPACPPAAHMLECFALRTPRLVAAAAGKPKQIGATDVGPSLIERTWLMRKSHSVAIIVVLCVFFAVFGIEALGSRIGGDAPIVVYASYLIDQHGYTPYVDVYDMNLPGTGYDDSSMRRFDLLVLLLLMLCTYALMRRFDKTVAWASALAFGVIHLGSGLYLQREFLMLMPVTLGTMLSPAVARPGTVLKTLSSGVCFGAAMTIKPHAVIAAISLVLFHVTISVIDRRDRSTRDALQMSAVFGAGLFVPLCLMFAYIVRAGALDAFLEMARDYWPLYGSYDGLGNELFAWSRAEHLLKGVRELGRNGIWLLPAGAATYYALFHSHMSTYQKRCVLVLGALAFVFCLYPVLTGQFWHYHWLPFRYFIVLISSLCLLAIAASRSRYERLFLTSLILPALFISMQPPRTMYSRIIGKPAASKSAEVDRVASFLREQLRPGDTVQPLDWSEGAVHAMLISRAEVATPYIYDFYFYHHISNPYIQRMRRRFMESLTESKPRFIVDVYTEAKPWPRGADTTRDFAELKQFMDSGYEIAMELENFRVYERLPVESALQRHE
jgi:hypothetical protein